MTDYFVRYTADDDQPRFVYIDSNDKASNRLDRITSGLMLICKTSKDADTLGLEMRSRSIEKEYICRVSGEFPRYAIERIFKYTTQWTTLVAAFYARNPSRH